MRYNWLPPLAISLLLSAAALSGCSNPNGERRSETNYGSQKDAPAETSDRAYASSQSGVRYIHQNTKLAYSRELSDAIGNLPGVKTAIVMLTERHAYAAIMIDNTATGTIGGTARKETNNSGTSQGFYNAVTGSSQADRRQLATGFNSGYTTEHEEHLSHAFKQTVALTIRKRNPLVHEVFISANRDFLNQMNIYAQESWRGQALELHAEEFNAICSRVFAPAEQDAQAKD